MPVYRTKPDLSLDDLVGQLQANGEKIVTTGRADGQWVVITEVPVNDTGRAWAPNNLGKTETRSA